jgi:hypothetical protein
VANTVRVIAPLRMDPFPQTPIDFCRLRVTLLAGAPTGITSITPLPGSALCIDAGISTLPCTATGATVSIGAAAGTATLAYSPAPGSTIAIPAGGSSIGVNFQPGGAGDSIVVSGCTITGDSVFQPVSTMPSPLTFAGSQPDSGSIGLRCLAPSPGGTGQLSCAQSINGQAPVQRTWNVSCANTFVAPTTSYVPAAGSTVNVVSVNTIGEIERASIAANIAGNGVGSGLLATTTISNCAASNGFFAGISGGSLTATGTQGASGEIALSCVAGPQAQLGVLTCDQNRAGSVTTQTWNLNCPAGRPLDIFADGFE